MTHNELNCTARKTTVCCCCYCCYSWCSLCVHLACMTAPLSLFFFNWSYILEQQLAQCGLILAMTSQSWLAVTIISTLVTLSLRSIAEGMTIETAVVYILTLIGVCRGRDIHSYISYIVFIWGSTHLRVAGALAPWSAWFVLLTLLRAESYVDHQKHNRKNLRSNWTLTEHGTKGKGVEQWADS